MLCRSGLSGPTFALVDGGVDGSLGDFAPSRLITQVDFDNDPADAQADGYGHGTLVAGLAAGGAHGYTGVVPNANLVSLDVLGDDGAGTLGDVIAAANWIYEHRNDPAYPGGIRVANFSLGGSVESSFVNDPLDRAVERLWLAGVVVVVAAGNYATDGAESGVLYAPANDPFVITVGASELNGTSSIADDVVAPWSAWGYTPDGFAKPDLSAPGRVLYGPTPQTSAMYVQHPERWATTPGYMWMSGTSFAAPIVSGAAAWILAAHPNFTPDQVKGALMVSAQPGAPASGWGLGVGGLRAGKAAAVANPPNPNLALQDFLDPDPQGGTVPIFDPEAWAAAAANNPAWNSASWSSASWSSASWSSASWSSASWSSASWSSASWSSGFSGDDSSGIGSNLIWVR
jgi:serine protease AprX